MSTVARAAHKFFVYNLPWTVNAQKLRTYFSKYGQVLSANVVFDRNTGLSRGYGFVVYSNPGGFGAAQNVEKHSLEGNIISLQPSN